MFLKSLNRCPKNLRTFLFNILWIYLCVSLSSQSLESPAKKPNKTPVKQNGPAGKPSGSAVKAQIKVGKAAQLGLCRIENKTPDSQGQANARLHVLFFSFGLVGFCG